MNAQNLDLETYTWENRIVLILTADERNEQYLEQLKLFKDQQKELQERKLLLFDIHPNKFRSINSQNNNKNNWKFSKTPHQEFSSKNKPFTIILIGLDGGIKLEKNKILSTQDLFSIIDGMPMRRAELRNKAKNH